MANREKYVLCILLILGMVFSASAKSMRTAVYVKDMKIEPSSVGYDLSFDCSEVFSDRVKQRLSRGFTSRVVVSGSVTGMKGKELIAQGLLRYTIRYDIWEERFAVRVEGLLGSEDIRIRTMDDLVKRFGSVHAMHLARIPGASRPELVLVRVRIVVNPASEELKRKVREYIANPDGRSDLGVPRSFFGSFSRIFVDEKKLQADALLLYKSPPLGTKSSAGGR